MLYRPHFRSGLAAVTMAAALAAATPALAQYSYSFSAAPVGFEPFAFSFNTPALLSAGDAFSFAPFTITDGSTTWTITQGSSTTLSTQGRCFLFGTADVTLVSGAETQCSLGTPDTGANFWFFDGDTTLPTTTGTTTGLYVVVFSGASPASGGADFDGKLTVSAVPEPQQYLLLLGGLAAVGWMARRRRV